MAKASPSDARAGGAYVEVYAKHGGLSGDLSAAEAKVRAYTSRVKQLQKEAAQAAKSGDTAKAASLTKAGTALSERQQTLAQQTAGRAALAIRLEGFKAQKLAAGQAAAEALKAEQAAASQAAAVLAGDRQALEDRLFSLTHTAREVELRDLDRHFTAMRAKYQGNAAMLAQIEQTANAERAAINQRYQQGVSGKGLIRGGAQSIGQLAKGVGAAGVGGDASYVAQIGLMLGATAGIAAAGVLLVKRALDKAADTAKRLKDETEHLRQVAKRTAEIFERRGPTTDMGQRYRQYQKLQQEEADRLAYSTDDPLKEAGFFLNFYEELDLSGNAKKKRGRRERQPALDRARYMAMQAGAKAVQQEALARYREYQDQRESTAMAWLEAGPQGPSSQRTALQQRQQTERRKAEEQNKDAGYEAVDLNLLAQRQAAQRLALERDLAQHVKQERRSAREAEIGATTEGITRERALLQQRHADEIADYDEAGRDKTELLRRHAAERLSLENQVAQQMREDARSAEEARIQATSEGFNQTIGLLKARHAAEVEEYDRLGKDKTALLLRHQYEEQALYRQQALQIRDIVRGILRSFASSTAQDRELDWMGIEEQLRKLGVLEDRIKAIRQMWQAAMDASDNRAIREQILESYLRQQVLMKQMTEDAAERIRLERQHPGADPALLDQLQRGRKLEQSLNFVQEERERFATPAMRMREYAEKVNQAGKLGIIDSRAVEVLLQAKRAELFTGSDTAAGTFNAAGAAYMAAGDSVGQRSLATLREIARSTRKMADKPDARM
jgi:hypothetical protein